MSLKCMIGKWLHKGQISQEEYDAVIKKLDGHDKQIRADALDEVIETLAKSEDTILTDKQYYALMELKGAENE